MKQPDQGQVAELARDAHHDVVQGAGGGTLVARTEELSDLSCQFLLEMFLLFKSLPNLPLTRSNKISFLGHVASLPYCCVMS